MSSHLEALQAALRTGELRVEWDGRVITYRSVDEILRAIQAVQAEEDAANGVKKGPRQVRTNGYSGWRRRSNRS